MGPPIQPGRRWCVSQTGILTSHQKSAAGQTGLKAPLPSPNLIADPSQAGFEQGNGATALDAAVENGHIEVRGPVYWATSPLPAHTDPLFFSSSSLSASSSSTA